jgi:tRNA-dihydrouridine synthase A
MMDAVDAEITVKCRIGVDDQVAEEALPEFLNCVSDVGIKRVIIHARKAWLKGLSPKENREIPPLDYDLVARMLSVFPDLHISLNGGVTSLEEAQTMLDRGFHGVMFGRAAYHNPGDILGSADRVVFGDSKPDRLAEDVVRDMLPYIQAHLDNGGKLHQITRHMLGLFTGRPGARAWRRVLSEGATQPDAGTSLVERALGELDAVAVSA